MKKLLPWFLLMSSANSGILPWQASPETIRQRISALEDAGIHELIIDFPVATEPDFLVSFPLKRSSPNDTPSLVGGGRNTPHQEVEPSAILVFQIRSFP